MMPCYNDLGVTAVPRGYASLLSEGDIDSVKFSSKGTPTPFDIIQ